MARYRCVNEDCALRADVVVFGPTVMTTGEMALNGLPVCLLHEHQAVAELASDPMAELFGTEVAVVDIDALEDVIAMAESDGTPFWLTLHADDTPQGLAG